MIISSWCVLSFIVIIGFTTGFIHFRVMCCYGIKDNIAVGFKCEILQGIIRSNFLKPTSESQLFIINLSHH